MNDEMTQKALADRVGISRQTMNAIENCQHAPTVSVAIRIADVFHASVDQLFDLEYDGKPTRREQPTNNSPGRPRAPIEKPVEGEPEPYEEDVERQVTLTDLRSVVGP